MEPISCFCCSLPASQEVVFRALWRYAINLDLYVWQETDGHILSIEDMGDSFSAHFHIPDSEDVQFYLYGSHYRFTDRGRSTLALLVGACDQHMPSLKKAQKWVQKVNTAFSVIEYSSLA